VDNWEKEPPGSRNSTVFPGFFRILTVEKPVDNVENLCHLLWITSAEEKNTAALGATERCGETILFFQQKYCFLFMQVL